MSERNTEIRKNKNIRNMRRKGTAWWENGLTRISDTEESKLYKEGYNSDYVFEDYLNGADTEWRCWIKSK